MCLYWAQFVFIIILVTPILSLTVDGSSIEQNDTINLIVSKDNVYKIVCSSINSKPDVDLLLYDTKTLLPLSNGLNNKSTGYCDSNDLCTRVLQVDFQFTDSKFINMTSLTCAARSNSYEVDLFTSLQRNVSVKDLSK